MKTQPIRPGAPLNAALLNAIRDEARGRHRGIGPGLVGNEHASGLEPQPDAIAGCERAVLLDAAQVEDVVEVVGAYYTGTPRALLEVRRPIASGIPDLGVVAGSRGGQVGDVVWVRRRGVCCVTVDPNSAPRYLLDGNTPYADPAVGNRLSTCEGSGMAGWDPLGPLRVLAVNTPGFVLGYMRVICEFVEPLSSRIGIYDQTENPPEAEDYDASYHQPRVLVFDETYFMVCSTMMDDGFNHGRVCIGLRPEYQ